MIGPPGTATPQTLGLVNCRVLRYRAADACVALDPGSTCLLLERGRITAIGDDRTIRDRAGTRADFVDLRGAVVAPGFIDAHIHAFHCAMGSLKVSCLPPGVGSLAVMKARLRERAGSTPPDEWIVGEGYDDMRIIERRHPTRRDLDEAVPDHPAIVSRVCGHMSVVNSRALEIAGIDRNAVDPPGGAVVRDAAGVPTGLLLERAQDLVRKAIPPADGPEIARALGRTAEALVAHGVTTICEALLGAFHPMELEIWSEVLAEGWPGPRVLFLADPRVAGSRSEHGLPIIGTKLFADGVVTGRTAAVSQPFEGDADRGMLVHHPDVLAELAERSARRGLPVGIHAMGDRGIETAIAAIERAGGVDGNGATSERHERKPLGVYRIEHCTLPSAASLQVMASLGIAAVCQPVFLFAEGEGYRAQLGDERAAYAYPLRTMRRNGLRPALSSDAPATSSDDAINPWLGIAAAATRRTWAGSQLGTAETISIGEAIGCYTANAASALSIEDRTGSIGVGKEADLVVLPQDPLSVAPLELQSLRPQLVFVKGHVVYERT